MKKEYNMKFITPCFCVGADQKVPEIRAASIRGELRKWLRLTGVTSEQEQHIMGGINGEATKSLVTVRVSNVDLAETKGVLPRIGGIDPKSYLLHFANVSGKVNGQKSGPRVKDGAFIAPKSTFKLIVITKSTLNGVALEIFNRALKAMLLLGSLGLRSTRTCGAWVCQDFESVSLDELTSAIKGLDLNLELAVVEDSTSMDWKSVIYALGTVLKDGYRTGKQNGRKTLSAGKSGNDQTPLGASSPRQKSGLTLRPTLTSEGIVPLMYYTEAFLGNSSKRVNFDFEESFDGENCSNYQVKVF